MRHRRRQAAPDDRDPADPGPRPRRTARGAGPRLRRRARPPARRPRHRAPRRTARPDARRPDPGRARPGPLPEAARPRPRRRPPARGPERPERDPSRSGEVRPRDHGCVGGAEGSVVDNFLFGVLPETIAARAKPPVIVVKTRERIDTATFEELAARAESLAAAERAAEESRAVPARVERWFGESNFHHAEFRDLRRLVALKEKQGVTVSLILPTLNEAATVGPIVRRARMLLMEAVPLVDELLVIDSASDDRTCEIAAREGARVVQHADVLTRYGSYRGKGEVALEEPLRVLRRHRRLVRHGRPQLAPADGLRDARSAPRRAADPVRQGLLPAPHRGGRRAARGRRGPRHRAGRAAPDQPLLPGPLGVHPAARRRVRGAPKPARVDPLLHRLRGGDRAPHRHRGAGRPRGAGPGGPGAPHPPQPGARGALADELRDHPGRHEAAGGAPPRPALRGDGLHDEAAALRGPTGWASRSSSSPTASARR